MSRTEYILGRVRRNLRRHGLDVNQVKDPEILDEITMARNHILASVNPGARVVITLNEDEDTYSMKTDDSVLDPEITVASIKLTRKPSDWSYPFKVITNIQFSDFIDGIDPEAIEVTTQPLRGTIIGGELVIYPVPDSTYAGAELEFYVYQKGMAGNTLLTIDDEPGTEGEFDKAIEFYTTAQFLAGDERTQYETLCEKEINDFSPLSHRNTHTLSRASVF